MKEKVPSNNELPLVSIGIPVYNGERFLEKTIISLCSQTYENIEFIFRDNNSTDTSLSIINDYALQDKRIRVFQAFANEGAAKNYNAVFSLANGKYFKWAAADDLLDSNFILKCVDFLEEQHQCVIAYPRTVIIDENDTELSKIEDELIANQEDAFDRYKSFHTDLKECNAVFGVIRKNALARTRLIQPYIAADAHLLAELSLHGTIEEIPEFLFYRRDHPTASSADKSESAQAEFYDPKRAKRPLMSHWAGFKNDLIGIFCAPQSFLTKARLATFFLRKYYWQKDSLFKEFRQYCHYLINFGKTRIYR